MNRCEHTLWLSWPMPAETNTPYETAMAEISAAQNLPKTVVLKQTHTGDEAYEIRNEAEQIVISGDDAGLLYGVYEILMADGRIENGIRKPAYAYRMINCWDNMDGTIERGYSGRSLWFDNGRIAYDASRIRLLARHLASVGINVICINNVNVHQDALSLIDEHLDDVAELASIFRAYHVRLMLSISFAHPLSDGIATADPLNPAVIGWWERRTALV